MKHYYITDNNNNNGFEEITENEWVNLIGEEPYSKYANQVYKNVISIKDVPEELRETVQEIVNNKIARFGKYESTAISPIELQQMIEEVL